MELAPKCKFYTTEGGKSEEEIRRSEQILNIKFSNQSREFYEKYGYLSFYGNEIFGIDPDDDSGMLEGNSVAYALNDRKEYNLPKEWIPMRKICDDVFKGIFCSFDFYNTKLQIMQILLNLLCALAYL